MKKQIDKTDVKILRIARTLGRLEIQYQDAVLRETRGRDACERYEPPEQANYHDGYPGHPGIMRCFRDRECDYPCPACVESFKWHREKLRLRNVIRKALKRLAKTTKEQQG